MRGRSLRHLGRAGLPRQRWYGFGPALSNGSGRRAGVGGGRAEGFFREVTVAAVSCGMETWTLAVETVATGLDAGVAVEGVVIGDGVAGVCRNRTANTRAMRTVPANAKAPRARSERRRDESPFFEAFVS